MRVLYALLPLTLAYRGAVPAARSRTAAQAQPRLAACMCTGDAAAEARRRWLERTSNSNGGTSWQRQQQGADGDATRSPEDAIIERQREREDARKRMLAMMGGDNEQLRSGLGVQFGYGAPDDTNYGYGPQPEGARRDDDDDDGDGREFWPEWLTNDPVGAKDAKAPPGASSGFDGREDGWTRKVDLEDPNPPPMANTLRTPSSPNSVHEYMGGLAFSSVEDPEPKQQKERKQRRYRREE